MDKKKYIIIGTVVLLVLIIATVFMFKGKQPKEGDAKNLSESNSIDEEGDEEKFIYQTQGDSEKTTEEIDEYISSMKTEEIQEVLNKETSEEQRETLKQAIKDNEIILKNQEWAEINYSDNSFASMQDVISYNLSTMFNEFLVDAQLGKYEYEKIGAMLATYASDLEQDIKNSNKFSDEEITVLSAAITEKLVYLNNALYPYLGSSVVKSKEDLIAQGIIEEDEEVHPYQEIVDSTIEEVQQIEQEKQEEILGISNESVIIPDGATEYKPPEVAYYSHDENGNVIEAPANPPWAVPVN